MQGLNAVKAVFHFFVMTTHTSKHNQVMQAQQALRQRGHSQGKRQRGKAVRLCFPANQVKPLNSPSVIKNIRYGSGTESRKKKKLKQKCVLHASTSATAKNHERHYCAFWCKNVTNTVSNPITTEKNLAANSVSPKLYKKRS